MLGVVCDRPDVLVARRKIDAPKTIGVGDRAGLSQVAPDRMRILNPGRIEMVEITGPIGNWRSRPHLKRHSSIMSMAISGQLALASHALSSRPSGTVP